MRIRTTRKPCSLNVMQTWGGGVCPTADPRPVPGQVCQGGSSHLWFSCKQGYPTGIHVPESRRNKLGKPIAFIRCFVHGMTSAWPSSIHFSPGNKCIYAVKDGKSGFSFLTWLPTPAFPTSCTCKKNLCRQPACFSVSLLNSDEAHPSLCGVERRQDGFFLHTPAQMQAFIAHSILRPECSVLY